MSLSPWLSGAACPAVSCAGVSFAPHRSSPDQQPDPSACAAAAEDSVDPFPCGACAGVAGISPLHSEGSFSCCDDA
jgi:hypothetical protein